jgi:anti-anti-sigma regulatory factor
MSAAPPTFRIERQPSDAGSRFRLVGRLEGAATRTLDRMLAGPASDGGVVFLDLSQLESCDEAGADVLVTLTKRAHTASGDLLLQFVPNALRDTLSATGALPALHLAPEWEGGRRQPPVPHYIFRAGESSPFAYASSRHDFSLVSDGSLWAHLSHDWLLEAGSGAVLAHRTHGSYFSVDSGVCLYSEQPGSSRDTGSARPRS